ncbi:hypothetical protein [Variovorax sp. DXTD-1]|uniref:hypothetical protein n=1 Tax=Variovorax sp. DXTD-1 TaxID=2495592 RepID=UPI000F86A049|nr:hypothetical protein [Variovorax sp. DXTD-1]RST45550.1 hypothetical protein EJI00_23730 [Variovorax sp. DXTD-1]
MSKIVQAVNSMIANRSNISLVQKGAGGELFFVYKGKYVWSMTKNSDGVILWYYPNVSSPENLVYFEGGDWEDVAMVTYKDWEIGTREAKSTFSELYMVVSERLYGVDQMLDDIIDDLPF